MVIFPNSSKNQKHLQNQIKQGNLLVEISRKAKKNPEPGPPQNLLQGQRTGHRPDMLNERKPDLLIGLHHDHLQGHREKPLKDQIQDHHQNILKGLHQNQPKDQLKNRLQGLRQDR